MIKLIALIIFVLPLLALSPVMLHRIGLSSGCGDCIGTYEYCYTSDYPGDTDKACLDSGSSTVDGTATGATIQSDATLGGTNNVLLDADGEKIDYSVSLSANIWQAGYIIFSFKTPATLRPTGDQTYLTELYYGSNDEIRIYCTSSSDVIAFEYDGNNGGSPTVDYGIAQAVSTSTIYTIGYSWDNSGGTDKHASYIMTGVQTVSAFLAAASGNWDVDTESLGDWQADPTHFYVGDYANAGIDGSWLVKNYYIGNTYEGD